MQAAPYIIVDSSIMHPVTAFINGILMGCEDKSAIIITPQLPIKHESLLIYL